MGHDSPSRGIGSTDPSRGCGCGVEVRLRLTAVDGDVPGRIEIQVATGQKSIVGDQ